jgi:hypothetical protein
MKTYKQQNQELRDELTTVYKRLAEVCGESESRKFALENASLFDPVSRRKLLYKYSLAKDGLNAIKAIAPVNSEAKIIATEVLLQIDAL